MDIYWYDKISQGRDFSIVLYLFESLICKEHDKRAHLFTDEHKYRRILQEVMKKLDEAEKELALYTDVLSLVEDTFIVADGILAIVLNRLQFWGQCDYMSPEALPEPSAWWRQVKIRESLIGCTNKPNISLYMLRAKIGVLQDVDYRIHTCHKNIYVSILAWSVYICTLKLNNNCE